MRVNYSTTLEKEKVKQLKLLAIESFKNANDLLEEALDDLFVKYANKSNQEQNVKDK